MKRSPCLLVWMLVSVACQAEDGGPSGGTEAVDSTSNSSGNADEGPDGDASDTSAGGAGGTEGAGTTSESNDDDGSTSDDGTGTSESDDTATGTDGGPVVDPDGALFVRPDGMNSNPGTQDAPMRTIQWALAEAEADRNIDTIYVAAGMYTTRYEDGEQIRLLDGVSLYGGYSADWSSRDLVSSPSVITDDSAMGFGPSPDNPHRAVEIPDDVGPQTVFDGFSHEIGAAGPYRTAILVEGDAVVSNHRIEPGAPQANAERVTGIENLFSDATLTGNRILFSVAPGEDAVGMRVAGSGGVVANNVLILEGGDDLTAMDIRAGAPTIDHNSVFVEYGQAIDLFAEPMATVTNNALETASETNGVCIQAFDDDDELSIFTDNLVNCEIVYLRVFGTDLEDTIMGFEAQFPGSSGSVRTATSVFDLPSDLELDADDPCVATRGGTLLPDVPTDINGSERTDPVSLGAHEWDGDCQ